MPLLLARQLCYRHTQATCHFWHIVPVFLTSFVGESRAFCAACHPLILHGLPEYHGVPTPSFKDLRRKYYRFSFRGNKLPYIADGRYQKSSICEHVFSFFRYWHHEELSHSRSMPFSERIAGLYTSVIVQLSLNALRRFLAHP